MTQYLGICMVVIVTGLVIAVLAHLVTSGILEEIERIKKKRYEHRMTVLAATLKESTGMFKDFISYAKEAAEMDKKYGEEGKKYSDEAFKKATDKYMKEKGIM